jgi:hypothetical protein
MKLSDLKMGEEPSVGEVYLTPCLDLTGCTHQELPWPSFQSYQKAMHAIPVLGNHHQDPEFRFAGGEKSHYHVDMRFLEELEFKFLWNTTSNYANNNEHVSFPIVPIHFMKNPPKPSLQAKVCFRTLADFSDIRLGQGDDYSDFEDDMEKHTLNLENPVCGHHGTSLKGMCVKNGIVTCPLHGARWSATTGKYVRKTP